MKVYLAGRYEERNRIQSLSQALVDAGAVITSTWHQIDYVKEFSHRYTADSDFLNFCANKDLRDIRRADALICFGPSYPGGSNSGGRHVELGYALGLGKKIVFVGEPENVFHSLGRKVALFFLFDPKGIMYHLEKA